MTSRRQRKNHTKIVPYHYSEFGVQEMHITDFDDKDGQKETMNYQNTQRNLARIYFRGIMGHL
jgi:hypothetical protein